MAILMGYLIVIAPFGFIAYWLLLARWNLKSWRERRSAYIGAWITILVVLLFLLPLFLIMGIEQFMQSAEGLGPLAFLFGYLLGFISHVPFTHKESK